MADAEDLKSSGDFSSCGFDSHPGHHSVCSANAACLHRILERNSLIDRFARGKSLPDGKLLFFRATQLGRLDAVGGALEGSWSLRCAC